MDNAEVCDSIGYSMYNFFKSRNYTGHNINISRNSEKCLISVSVVSGAHPLDKIVKRTWLRDF